MQNQVVAGLAALGPDAAAAAQSDGSGTLDLKDMPAAMATIVRTAYGDATGRIFLIAAIVAVVALVAVLFIREVPLRTTVALQPEQGTADIADSVDTVPVTGPVGYRTPVGTGSRT